MELILLCVTVLAVGYFARPYVERYLQVAERKMAAEVAPVEAAAQAKSDPIPPDLIMYAGSFEQEWAKDQTLDRAYELYATTGNWNKVRQLLFTEESSLTYIDRAAN